MKKGVIALLAGVLFLVISCTSEDQPGLTIGDFERDLNASMSWTEVVSRFGEPSSDIGSGIHIYVYPLADSTELWIGYTTRILYAVQMDRNRQEIRRLI